MFKDSSLKSEHSRFNWIERGATETVVGCDATKPCAGYCLFTTLLSKLFVTKCLFVVVGFAE